MNSNGHTNGFDYETEKSFLQGIFDKLKDLKPGEIPERRLAQFRGREFVREADQVWRDQWGAVLRLDEDDPLAEPEIIEPPPAWSLGRLSRFDGIATSPQPWFMGDWIPRGQCTGLYGIPGARKSLWVLQALICGALGREFCGEPIEGCPVIGLFCEDPDAEIHRRSDAMLKKLGRCYGELLHCHTASLVGAPVTEFLIFTRSGAPVWSPAWRLLQQQVMDIRPGLVALDVLPDFFGANENVRREVHTFIRGLDRLGQDSGAAILFSAHPSVRGMAEASLASGSTGWEGKVRARLTLHDPASMDDEESETPGRLRVAKPQSDERILTRVKSNYAKQGAEIPLTIEDNAIFRKVGEAVRPTGQMRNLQVDEKFMELLAKVEATGGYVIKGNGHRSAPKVFSQHPDRGDIDQKAFAKAMERLLASARIKEAAIRRAGKPYMALVAI